MNLKKGEKEPKWGESNNKRTIISIAIIVVLILGMFFLTRYKNNDKIKNKQIFSKEDKVEILNELLKSKDNTYSEVEKKKILDNLNKDTDKSMTLQQKIETLNSLRRR